MCGICGIINFSDSQVYEYDIRSMMSEIKHRGPDDDGIYLGKNFGLGFVRLSILDLSHAGHQPMFSKDGRYVMIYNGEIYNYIELRNELLQKGHRFRSNTDSEVLLNSYIEWGDQCLDKFNGMWAFCIYDKVEKRFFFSRDRYGVKPFYYYADENRFIFASEIKAILKLIGPAAEINYQSLYDYFVFSRTDQTEKTFYSKIQKLQHGHVLEIRDGEPDFKIRKWYDLKQRVSVAEPFKSPEEFRELFSSAVGLRLRSDVPVGVCLSGGIDSSSITSVLLEDHAKKDLNTFSAVYQKGQRGDESEFISEFDKFLTSMFYTYPTADTLYSDLDDFTDTIGEPVPNTGPYAQYKVMELAKDHVVVTLDGQGADELLAGYHYFYGFLFKELLKEFRFLKLFREVTSYIEQHNSFYGVKSLAYLLVPLRFKSIARAKLDTKYLNNDFVKQYESSNEITGNLYSAETLNEALIDHFEHKLEHLLKWEDRTSMRFSLEARVPFLDYRLVERTLASSLETKISNGVTKSILRQSMNGTLPRKIANRKDKMGFVSPTDEWFRTKKFQSLVKETIDQGYFFNNGILLKKNAEEMYNDFLHGKGRNNLERDIWKWINSDRWVRIVAA